MTIYGYIEARRLVAHKIGKEFRIQKAEFEPFPEENQNKLTHESHQARAGIR
jgi:hypothetical protein